MRRVWTRSSPAFTARSPSKPYLQVPQTALESPISTKEVEMKLSVKGLAPTAAILWGGCILLVGVMNLIWSGYGPGPIAPPRPKRRFETSPT